MTNKRKCGIISNVGKREWRNWQTRTFEGRVVTPYGFKSRFSHHSAVPNSTAETYKCGYGGIGSFENERTPYEWRSEFEKAQKQGELRQKEQGDYVSSGLAGAAAI